MGRAFLLTGKPGVGKTTALVNTIGLLRGSGATVGGMVSREVRVGGIRKGFEIVDILTNRKGTLADVAGDGPRFGRYRVNLADLDAVGVGAIRSSMEGADIVAIDEIGPMELLSTEFLKAICEVLESEKPVIGTIHINLRRSFVAKVRPRWEVEIIEVTRENRDEIPRKVADSVLALLGGKYGSRQEKGPV
jgi:nucleoside-triphosphatase